MGHNPSSPGAWRPTLGPGKASFCFNFTVSSRHPEQLPICKGGSGGPSWETRRHGRGGVEKMQPKTVRRDGEGKMGQGPERTGIRRRKRRSDQSRPTCGRSSSKCRRTPASCSSLWRKAGGWCTSTGGAWLGSRTASSQYSSLGSVGSAPAQAALSPHSILF